MEGRAEADFADLLTVNLKGRMLDGALVEE